MQRGRYARYSPEALSLVKLARLRALQKGAKTCEPADVLTAVLEKLPPVLTAVLSANGLVLAKIPDVPERESQVRGDKKDLDAARLVPLSRGLRRCLDWAEEQAGEERVSGCMLFKSVWGSVVVPFSSATLQNGSQPDPATLKFPTHQWVMEHQMAAEEVARVESREGVSGTAPGAGWEPLPAAILAYGREMGTGEVVAFVGRERELESIISVLLKFFKPNPLLVGETGVGKTALLEALARKIRSGQVPPALRGKRLVEVSANALLAGASFPGELESRFEGIFEAVRRRPEVILFIDEIHSLVTASRGISNGPSVVDLLKPVLSRSDFQLIGATTNAEYQRYIAKEEALARRFQPVQIDEPTPKMVHAILENAAPQLARHHGIKISSNLFASLIRLCVEELPSRRFPDKALDVLDRACAAAAMNGASALNAGVIQRAVADLAGIPYAHSSPEFQDRLAALEAFLSARVVGQDAIVHSVASTIRLCKHRLDPRPCRPDGVFLFLGPTGVGKTSMALAIAEAVSGSTEALIRLDMAEYNNSASSTRLLGADPGYVGHDSETTLVRGLLAHHAGVLLLDEFDKAHPEVQQLFLGAFDEGRLRDAKGRSHSLSNFTVVATSNAGGKVSREVGFSNGTLPGTGINGEIPKELLAFFSAELLNRFDEVVIFNPLEEKHLRDIFHNQLLHGLNERLAEDSGVFVEVREELVQKVMAQADCDRFGARELQRVFQRLVSQPVMRLLQQAEGTDAVTGVRLLSLV